jgi:hypothetical protein
MEDKLFSVESSLEIIKMKKESFPCEECEFVGKNQKGINIHIKRIHRPSNEETISDDKVNKMEKRIYKLEKIRIYVN